MSEQFNEASKFGDDPVGAVEGSERNGVDEAEEAAQSDTGPTGHPDAAAPETGDLVIDAALRDLAEAPQDDLDAQIERGEQVQRTLQGRLGDLGG